MSISLGLILTPLLLIIAILQTKVSITQLWDPMAFTFVCLGSIFSISVSFGFSRIFTLFKLFFRRVFQVKGHTFEQKIKTILILSRAKRSGYEKFSQLRSQLKDPFIRDVSYLLDWAENDISSHQFKDILEIKSKTFSDRYQLEVSVFESFTKLPLKFGILYSFILLISKGIAINSDTGQILLNYALTPILYGLVISYLFLSPVAKNLRDSLKDDKTARSFIIDGIFMIHQNLASSYIEEKMLSYLLPSERSKIVLENKKTS